ncbi:MAG: Acyl-CoA synthetase, partial [Verrucomicrobiales bacterium]|nr:Acyl-CoA synthetase [Verrucomicrobiales bacterium]
GVLEGVDLFAAEFFEISARESELMDPQHRLFLECAWETMEMAGYGGTQSVPVGCFAGASINTYLLNNLRNGLDENDSAAVYQATIGNDKDYLCTRVAYKLNLKGPALTIQTGCSSSLVAVHMACQSLLNGECGMALAGGVSILLPQKTGYLRQDGMILSSDGHCRAFDARADGTVSGNGLGLVLLKRAEEAIRDNDTIYALIKGSAINNDGSSKMGYTAPSVEGQATAVQRAMAVSGVKPETISFIEAHGTGTPLGDPIEIAGLTQAFGKKTLKRRFCTLGAVKTNIGHLDAAAGIAGLIKTILALRNKKIPGTLFFEQANPAIDLENSPFVINRDLKAWETELLPRRAGVSSFGIGGTNAHVVLEEAPDIARIASQKRFFLLILSARSASELQAMGARLCGYLQENQHISLEQVSYTLQVGRASFSHRYSFVCASLGEAIEKLKSFDLSKISASMDQTGANDFQFRDKNFPGLEAFCQQNVEGWGYHKSVLETVGEAWRLGSRIEWKSFYKAKLPGRISLPTYPFERKKYWIEPGDHKIRGLEERNPIEQWGYRRSWVQQDLPRLPFQNSNPIIVFCAGADWGRSILLRMGDSTKNCQIVSTKCLGPDYDEILGNHTTDQELKIIFISQGVELESDYLQSFLSLLELFKALERNDCRAHLTLVTQNCFEVIGSEPGVCFDALLSGLLRVIPIESRNIEITHLDVSLSNEMQAHDTIDLLAENLLLEPKGAVAAYRNGIRWAELFQPLPLDRPTVSFKEQGVYLLIGGLGDLGFSIAQQLASNSKARLVFAGNSLPSHLSEEKRQRLNALKALGGDVLYLSADVTNSHSLQAAFNAAEAHYGRLNGVIFSPGIRDLRLLKDSQEEDCRRQIDLRRQGLTVLEQVLEGKSLDFCFIVSSLSSILGAAGFGAYSAAHSFVDRFVQSHNRVNTLKWTSANFDNWVTERELNQDCISIRPSEGADLILRVLSQRSNQVIVSTTDLISRLALVPRPKAVKQTVVSKSFHERPEMASSFSKPRNESERKLVAIWEKLLGIQPIGIHDNFFDLGGDSIISIQILSAARGEGLEIGSQSILEHPTIAELLAQSFVNDAVSWEQGVLKGAVPLLPAQAWFFGLPCRNRNQFNHYVTMQTAVPMEIVEQAVSELLARHDALRLSFRNSLTGWEAHYGDLVNVFKFSIFNITGLFQEQIAAVEKEIDQAQSSLNLATGTLVKGLWFQSDSQQSCFTLIIHHLAVDAFSWSILISDLEDIARELTHGEKPSPRLKTASQRDWFAAVQKQFPDLRKELPYWMKLSTGYTTIPLDRQGLPNSTESSAKVQVEFTKVETDLFEKCCRQVLRCAPDELLLAAIALALGQWGRSNVVQLDCEGLGRSGIADLSRTVGWFTDLYPMAITTREVGHRENFEVDVIIQQIQRDKQRATHFAILNYLDSDSATLLKSVSRSEVIFVYLGRVPDRNASSGLFKSVEWGNGFSQEKTEPRSHELEFETFIAEGKLRIKLEYSTNRHHLATAEYLLKCMETILRKRINAGQFRSNQTIDDPEHELSSEELAMLLDDTN